MLALVLADALFALRERTLLSRVEVALLDGGVRVVHATPRGTCPDNAGHGVIAPRIEYAPAALAIMRSFQSRRLLRSFDALEQIDEGERPQIVHVFGGGAWNLGRRVARDSGAILVLEVWRAGLAHRAATFATRSRDKVVLLAPDPLIERELLQHTPRAYVVLAPWGVLPDEPRPILPPHRAACIMIVGGGRDGASFHSLLAGLAPVLRARPDVLVFCDAQAAQRADLWTTARTLGLLDRLSLVEDLEARRELILQGDILVLPEARGELRSVTLEAMARAIPVIAARDPHLSTLVEDRTARLVPAHDAGLWERALSDALDHPERARELGYSAQRFVRVHRRASEHLEALLSAYAFAKPAPAHV
jgi:glycosyltransferase involved in cell wall biosynthesis